MPRRKEGWEEAKQPSSLYLPRDVNPVRRRVFQVTKSPPPSTSASPYPEKKAPLIVDSSSRIGSQQSSYSGFTYRS
ncbi:unnamed protein product [Linum trigynum]|uniref:Uncharacterized protein n=1 Tax=Linum trigynum TaxID=586398 RepID=A0AAV2DEG5_9ROSI